MMLRTSKAHDTQRRNTCKQVSTLAIFISTLALSSTWLPTAAATGFVALPLQGFSLEDGSRSAYTLCNGTGKYSAKYSAKLSTTAIPVPASADAANTCAIFVDSELQAPLPGYELLAHAMRQAIMNNAYTGFQDKKIATVSELVWRNDEQGQCLFGSRVITLSSADADYDSQTRGKQYFRISDVAHGGFGHDAADGKLLEVAYAQHASKARPVYRVGRSFSAVSYQAGNSLRLPPLATQATPAINKEQLAALDSDWVNFTTEIGLPKHPVSPMLYIKTACAAGKPQTLPDLIRLRQADRPPLIELSLPGFAPPEASGLKDVSALGISAPKEVSAPKTKIAAQP
ncbi:MAG: hypothetical protein JNJ51_03880 [Methylobacillus glycogenes]|nr:hypothetical protein [Methylobacillus glycogenes]